MDNDTKRRVARFFVSSSCQDLKSSILGQLSEFRPFPLDEWQNFKPIAMHLIFIAETINKLRSAAPSSIRGRKASIFGHPAVTELKEIIDQKCRITTAKLDEVIANIETCDGAELERTQASLQQLKDSIAKYSFALLPRQSDDTRDDAAIAQELITFIDRIKKQSGDALRTALLKELLELHEHVTNTSSMSMSSAFAEPSSTPEDSPRSDGYCSSPETARIIDSQGRRSTPVEIKRSSGTAPSSRQPRTASSGASEEIGGAHQESSSFSRLTKSFVSKTSKVGGMFKKAAQKVVSQLSNSEKKGKDHDKHSKPTSPRNNAQTSSPKAITASPPTTQSPSPSSTPSSSPLGSLNSDDSRPPSGVWSSPQTPAVSRSSMNLLSRRHSSEAVLPVKSASESNLATLSPALAGPTDADTIPVKQSQSNSAPGSKSSSLSSADRPKINSAPPTPVLRSPRGRPSGIEPLSTLQEDDGDGDGIDGLGDKTKDFEREDAFQREVLGKFNLEGRIAGAESMPQPAASGSSAARAKRRAAVFTKATDRYSQLYSNVETEAKLDIDDTAHVWDEPDNTISFDADGVTAGSLNSLVKYLTSEKIHDGRFVNTFLLTYTSFTTPKALLEKLKQRYRIPKSKDLRTADPRSPSDSMNPEPHTDDAAARKSLQLRVTNTLRKWLEMCFLDFNDELINQVFEFVDELKRDGNASMASLIDNMLLTKLVGISKKKDGHHDSPPPPPIIPKVPVDQMTFDDIDTTELARQMTLLDHELYTEIRSSELLRQAWNKAHLKHRSPRVLETIQRFNSVSLWVSGTIVRAETLRERVRVMERFIALATQLRHLQNFNSMMAILSGLNNSAVFRLQTTKEALSQQFQRKWTKLQTLMSSSANFANYRQTLAQCDAPAVPYLGIYLSSLVFIEDGNQDIVKGLINFKKRRLVSKVIAEIQQYQIGKKYSLVKIDSVTEFITNLPEENDEELYKLSLLREPRKPKPGG